MIGALAFLLWTSIRNRLIAQIERVKSPRYAAALGVGVLYIWWFLIRPSAGGGAMPSAFLGQTSEALITLLVVVYLSGTWLFGEQRTALAFTPAEVSMLFTAPLSRRMLIGYKLVRAQLTIFISALIWGLLLHRGGAGLPATLRVLGLWVVFTTLNLHQLGAALVHTSSQTHGVRGVRRHWVSIAAFGAILATLLVAVFGARAQFVQASSPLDSFHVFVGILSSPPASYALFPFHLVIAPAYAHSIGEWARAMLPALALLLLHVGWVLWTDAAFEEAALEATAKRAKRLEAWRARRSATAMPAPKDAKRSIALGAVGHPAVAILWKNVLCMLRTSQLRQLLMPVVLAFAFSRLMRGRGGDAAQYVGFFALIAVGVLLVFGARLLRNDLRSDMQHLPFLKSLPLRGADLVVAEVASGAVPMSLGQFVLLVVAYVAFAMSAGHLLPSLSVGVRLALLVASPVVLLAINGTMFAILNGMAVLFPAWIRLGPSGGSGLETLGQNLLSTFGSLVMLLLLLILPALVGGVVFAVSRPNVALGIGCASTAGGLVLLVETYGLIYGLGRAFDRAEPSQVM